MIPTICYYISSHGYGHAARSRHVLAALSGRCRLIVKTGISRAFFGSALPADAQHYRETVDSGLVQPANTEIDWPASVRAAAEMLDRSEAGAAGEAAFLKEHRVDVVLCDIAPLGILAARAAGLPSFCITNFTWCEIFRHTMAKPCPGAASIADRFCGIYSQVTGCLRTPLGFPMQYMPLERDIDLIAGNVEQADTEIRAAANVPPRTKTVFIYLGNYGGSGLRIPTINKVTMLGYATKDPEITEICSDRFPAEKVIVSVDAVLAKPGYSTAAQCMAAGKALVTYPRPEFAEYFPMINQLRDWGGCIEMSEADFRAGYWEQYLHRAFALKPKHVPANGAMQAADAAMKHAGQGPLT